MVNNIQTVYLGGGCFWCIEAIFKNLKGVVSVMPGYAGGAVVDPTYEQVCGGNTGHAEVVEVEFNLSLISFNDLLEVFFSIHDPTTLNRQGNDVGTQYRSVIFTISPEQEREVKEKIIELTKEEIFKDKIVTEVKLLDKFYPAENYHHN